MARVTNLLRNNGLDSVTGKRLLSAQVQKYLMLFHSPFCCHVTPRVCARLKLE